MVEHGYLDVKVAVPCDAERRPIPADGIFHEKAGIVTDRVGDRLAWNGSLNETPSGWRHNWESINVYTSWGPEPRRVADEEGNFARIWGNEANRVIVLDTPEAVRRDLMRFLPRAISRRACGNPRRSRRRRPRSRRRRSRTGRLPMTAPSA